MTGRAGKKLTVVILTFRDYQKCITTINSLGNNELQAHLLIVDCNEEVDQVMQQNILSLGGQRIDYLRFPRSSIGQAMNFALKNTKTEFVWFLNSGDSVLKLGSLEDIILKEQPFKVLIGRTFRRFPNDRTEEWLPPKLQSRRYLYGFNSICHQSCIFPTKLLLQSSGFQDSPHFDWLATMTAINTTGIINIPSLEISYEVGGVSSLENLTDWARNRIEIRRLNRGLFGGNLIKDRFIYAAYLVYRLTANALLKSREGKWWKVGN
jgi:hypothetical protein